MRAALLDGDRSRLRDRRHAIDGFHKAFRETSLAKCFSIQDAVRKFISAMGGEDFIRTELPLRKDFTQEFTDDAFKVCFERKPVSRVLITEFTATESETVLHIKHKVALAVRKALIETVYPHAGRSE